MLWALGASGAFGLMLGLRFGVSALLVASGAMVAACLAVAHVGGFAPSAAVGMTLAMLCVLQFGYVAGLMLSCAWSRARLWLAARLTLTSGQRASHGKIRT
jgi:hypothetical protein